ncbi:hypothetical protein NC651_037181 [Populus alba x Populus x berolinensis]|nr:hypothetical protein NC651_037181 [Populus alba x Populus x berolinensis]
MAKLFYGSPTSVPLRFLGLQPVLSDGFFNLAVPPVSPLPSMCPDLDHPVHIDVAVANLEGPPQW